MATKAKKTIQEESAEKTASINSAYPESPIKGADPVDVNKALESIQLVKPKEANSLPVDGSESELYFLNGQVPAGFTKTYGQEITTIEDGQAYELVLAAQKVFKKEDGFRFFLKYLDNFIFSIVVPIRLSNQDELSYAYYKVDVRSCVLKPGNVAQQVESYAKKVARHLGYQKNR